MCLCVRAPVTGQQNLNAISSCRFGARLRPRQRPRALARPHAPPHAGVRQKRAR